MLHVVLLLSMGSVNAPQSPGNLGEKEVLPQIQTQEHNM